MVGEVDGEDGQRGWWRRWWETFTEKIVGEVDGEDGLKG